MEQSNWLTQNIDQLSLNQSIVTQFLARKMVPVFDHPPPPPRLYRLLTNYGKIGRPRKKLYRM